MKKIVLTLAVMLSMTTTFAASKNTSSNEAIYVMDNNTGSLARCLRLEPDQEAEVERIQSIFTADMKDAFKASDDKQQVKLRKAVKRNLRQLSYILNRDQMRTYLRIINATFVNRGIQMM